MSSPEPATGDRVDRLARELDRVPSIAFVDDAHHLAPDGAAELLGALARPLRRSVLLVATRRRLPTPPLAPGAIEVRVEPLASDELTALVRLLAARRGLTDVDVDAVEAMSGAIPELVYGAIGAVDDPRPSSALAASLAELTPVARRLLLAMAHLDGPVARNALIAAADATPCDASEAIATLAALGLVSAADSSLAATGHADRVDAAGAAAGYAGLALGCALLRAAIHHRRGDAVGRRGCVEAALAGCETGDRRRLILQALRGAAGRDGPEPLLPGVATLLAGVGLVDDAASEVVDRRGVRMVARSVVVDATSERDLVVDVAARTLSARGGAPSRRARPTICRLLARLIRAGDDGVNAATLYRDVWGVEHFDPIQSRNALHVNLSRLRQALAELMPERPVVETLADGWRIAMDVDACAVAPRAQSPGAPEPEVGSTPGSGSERG